MRYEISPHIPCHHSLCSLAGTIILFAPFGLLRQILTGVCPEFSRRDPSLCLENSEVIQITRHKFLETVLSSSPLETQFCSFLPEQHFASRGEDERLGQKDAGTVTRRATD